MKGIEEPVNKMGKRSKSNLGNALIRSRKAPGLSGVSKVGLSNFDINEKLSGSLLKYGDL